MIVTIETLTAVALVLTVAALTALATLLVALWRHTQAPPDRNPDPFPYRGEEIEPWVNDCYRRPRRGNWRKDCDA